LVLSKGRLLSLQRCLTLSVQNRLLLLLLQSTNAAKGRDICPNGLLRLLPQTGELLGRCLLGTELLETGLTKGTAESLLRTGNLPCGSEGLLACLLHGLLLGLPQASKGLTKLRACTVACLRLLAKDAAKLLLSTEALLCCLSHLLGQALLRCKLLPCGGLKKLAVALPCSKTLLSGCSAHASELLLCAKALSCGLPKLASEGLLGCKALLCFGSKLTGQGLLSSKTLGTGLTQSRCLSRLGCKALSLGLPHGRGKAFASTQLLPG